MNAPERPDTWHEVTDPVGRDVSVVATGGGHGLAANLRALRRTVTDLTAVVTVADNGGSSGRLRQEFGVLPPGDLRQALAALCGDDEWGRTWARVLQHRFASEGPLDSHAVGNLLIVGLWELVEEHVDGLDWVARLLGARGRVLPMAAVPLDIEAEFTGLTAPEAVSRVRGQVEVATTPGRPRCVSLVPEDPPAHPAALAAVDAADWIVFGPGSWYTSVLPHLLVPELRDHLCRTRARRCATLNLVPQEGETDGFSSATYLEVLIDHAPDLRIDVVLADRDSVVDMPELVRACDRLGAELRVERLASDDESATHDPARLADAYARIMG